MVTIFGERLLHLRKARGLTQKNLAQQLMVSQTCIYRYEQGLDEPSYRKLIHLAQFLGTTTDLLLGLTDCERIPSSPDAFLTPQEWELIGHFRQLSLRGRERALGYLQGSALSSRERQEQNRSCLSLLLKTHLLLRGHQVRENGLYFFCDTGFFVGYFMAVYAPGIHTTGVPNQCKGKP